MPDARATDGKSLAGVLTSASAPSPHAHVFLWRGDRVMAVRDAQSGHKLHLLTEGCALYNDPPLATANLLFDIDADPSEMYPLEVGTTDNDESYPFRLFFTLGNQN